MKIVAYIFLLLVSGTFSSCHYFTAAGIGSQGLPVKEVAANLNVVIDSAAIKIDHSAWTALLQKHVNKTGMVNYKAFKNDKKALNNYTQKLSGLQPTEKWPVQELLAYYINLYNSYTVKLIVDHYPLKSIQDIDGAFTNAIIPVGEKELSLAGLENGILRKMNEPRIHFAINCASISCPKLAKTAYTAAKIDSQLDAAARDFINSDKNELDSSPIKISKIFKWYEEDFTTDNTPTISAYINLYATTRINPASPVAYKPYNWALNAQN